jgi:hypothetical protein
MSEDRVDCLVNHLHVTCLTLLRLKKEAVYGQDPGFLELLAGYLLHSRQLMDLIRDREAAGRPNYRQYSQTAAGRGPLGLSPSR